ncbi:hypothetical protein B0T16DRAFT_460251 [Cercophora newfieldiana]|uniref:NACHT domain-containing protein n=1 Tax=Cercophora newfieldiana TaxID=92897 RepID=A0AA39Y2D9_9PEZI|nr:hypothetical protein B0T16DRAFT_460251 [Cercophora newfieldiana]
MDPASIIGVTSAVLSFIEAGQTFIRIAKRIYEAPSGQSEADSLKKLYKTVKILSEQLTTQAKNGKNLRPGTPGQLLCDLADQCSTLSETLIERIAKCIPKSQSLKSTLVAAKNTILGGDDIDRIQEQLDSTQRSLNLAVLLAMREETQSSLVLLQKLGFQQAKELQELRQWATRLQSHDIAQTLSALKDLREVFDLAHIARSESERLELFLAHLEFDSMTVRLSEVLDAYPSTFDYMFEDDRKLMDAHPKLEISFREWLVRGQGIFHVAGKPGSGKSTMMKYLVQDSRTELHLKRWAAGRRLIMANCFFWKYGTTLQRNIKGLIRSLLHTVLSRCPDLLDQVFPRGQNADTNKYDASVNTNPAITRGKPLMDSAIHAAFGRLLDTAVQIKEGWPCFCFFIDGLDEFEDPQEDYTDLVVRLKKWTEETGGNIKICVASRELPVFRNITSGQRIHLHLLTRGDIQTFVEKRIGSLDEFQSMRRQSDSAATACDGLIQQIITKAEGVFLWVYLVVQMLRRGLLENGDSINQLQGKLDLLPTELVNLFTHMLGLIEQDYREDAYRTFAVAMHIATSGEGRGWSLFRYSILFDYFKDQDFAINLPVSAINVDEIDFRLTRARKRLSACCNSLLEIQRDETERLAHYGWSLYRDSVNFIHRSVPEWLEQHLEGKIVGLSGVKEEASYHTLLAQVKLTDVTRYSTGDDEALDDALLKDIADVLQEAHRRSDTGHDRTKLMGQLDALDEALLVQQRVDPRCSEWWVWETFPKLPRQTHQRFSSETKRIISLLHLSARLGLYAYVSHRLQRLPTEAKGERGELLFECAISPFFDHLQERTKKTEVVPPRSLEKSLSILAELFRHGASPHSRARLLHQLQGLPRVTIWHCLLNRAFNPKVLALDDLRQDQALWELVQLFVRCGATPDFSLVATLNIEKGNHTLWSVATQGFAQGNVVSFQERVGDVDTSFEPMNDLVELLLGRRGRVSLPDLIRFISPASYQDIEKALERQKDADHLTGRREQNTPEESIERGRGMTKGYLGLLSRVAKPLIIVTLLIWWLWGV